MSKLSRKQLQLELRYDPLTGLFWWRRRKSHRQMHLAWLFMKGTWPASHIDHKDTNPTNNIWLNLREATNSQNKHNAYKYCTNTSGYKGVHWDREAKKWRAQIRVSGKGILLAVSEARN